MKNQITVAIAIQC